MTRPKETAETKDGRKSGGPTPGLSYFRLDMVSKGPSMCHGAAFLPPCVRGVSKAGRVCKFYFIGSVGYIY